jgi:hypothetical protein
MAAGLGFKTFTTGEVLTAADTNGYLMQGVLVFASAAARDAAITSPQEGQFAYLKDTNVTTYYTGSAWTNLDTTGMTNPMTTTGDMVYSSSGSTPARLGIGTTGQVLSVAGGIPSWATASSGSSNVAGKNCVLNSSFNIWQRGTTTTITSTSFVADRWQAIRSVAGATATRQTTSDTTNLPFIQYCLRVARDSGNTSTTVISMGQNFETLNSIPYAGKTVTMSFYARAGANFSAASGVLKTYLTSGTGTDQNNVTGAFTSPTQVVNQDATLTTTWQRFTFSGSVASTATQLGVQWQFTPVGTAGAADYYEITGVQVEIAASATAYSPCTSTYETELAACQRYYYRIAPNGSYRVFTSGQATSANEGFIAIPFPVQMRIRPTALDQSGTAGHYSLLMAAGTRSACTSVPVYDTSTTQWLGQISAVSTGALTAGNCTTFGAENASAYLGWSAEL